MRRAGKRLLFTGVLAGVAYGIWRVLQMRLAPPARDDVAWQSAPFPFPPEPRPPASHAPVTVSPATPAGEPLVAEAESGTGWVEADEGGACPASHPVKGKLSSGIFHLPGGLNYDRTRADRCYEDEAAAVADGLRRAQR